MSSSHGRVSPSHPQAPPPSPEAPPSASPASAPAPSPGPRAFPPRYRPDPSPKRSVGYTPPGSNPTYGEDWYRSVYAQQDLIASLLYTQKPASGSSGTHIHPEDSLPRSTTHTSWERKDYG
jgi:hypothetical protein